MSEPEVIPETVNTESILAVQKPRLIAAREEAEVKAAARRDVEEILDLIRAANDADDIDEVASLAAALGSEIGSDPRA